MVKGFSNLRLISEGVSTTSTLVSEKARLSKSSTGCTASSSLIFGSGEEMSDTGACASSTGDADLEAGSAELDLSSMTPFGADGANPETGADEGFS